MKSDLSASIYRYLAERPGQTVFRPDIARALNVSETQVRAAIGRLRQTGSPIEKMGAGAQAWRFVPEEEQKKSNGHATFEVLAVTKTGAWVVQDAEGNVTLLREVES